MPEFGGQEQAANGCGASWMAGGLNAKK